MLRSLLYFALAEKHCPCPATGKPDTNRNPPAVRGYVAYRLAMNPAVWLASRGRKNCKRLRAPKPPCKQSRQPSSMSR